MKKIRVVAELAVLIILGFAFVILYDGAHIAKKAWKKSWAEGH